MAGTTLKIPKLCLIEAFKIEYTKFGNPKPESYDRADAIVIAKAGFLIEQKNTMNKH